MTNDLGSALLYFGIFLAMLYVATAKAWFVAAGLALFVAGAAVVYQLVPRVEERVSIWLDPWEHAQTSGYQIVQSLYSIANGGFGGTGFGKGTFENTGGGELIPYLNTDFIYSALAQELGLVGAAALLLVFMLFCLRGFRIALLAQDGFSKLLAVGPDLRLRAPDVHHRRRRAAADPADRDHAPVRQLRRLEHRGELPPARGPPPRLAPGEPAAQISMEGRP